MPNSLRNLESELDVSQSANGASIASNSRTPNGSAQMTTPRNSPYIAIVGAGMAGLRAARSLLQSGYRVAVLESRDRIGGRICTSDGLGKDVDLGPNWVHGTEGNPIIPLSQQANSKLHEFSHNSPVFDVSGDTLEQKEAEELQTLFWEVVDQANTYSKEQYKTIPADRSFLDYCIEKASELFGLAPCKDGAVDARDSRDRLPGTKNSSISPSGAGHVRWKGEQLKKKEQFIALAEMWGSFIGSAVERQSLKFFYLEEPIDGPNLFVASTYKPMVETLALPVKSAGVIRLNTTIASVTTKVVEGGRKRVFLTSSDSSGPMEFDAVIVTIPLGCLKQSQIRFTPSLPARIQQSIDALSYGHLEKVYINFPTAFWGGDKSRAFFTFLKPTYAADTNPHSWHMCCFSLAHLPEPHAQPTLLFYIFGATSKHLVGTFAPAEVEEGHKQYVEFFRPYFSRLNGYDPESADCQPTKLVATRWSNDKLAGYGSYSNFQIGLEDGEEDIAALRRGIPEERIWFAGEHTAPVLGLGSVSGAYWSGEAAAEKVLTVFSAAKESEATTNDKADAKLLNGFSRVSVIA